MISVIIPTMNEEDVIKDCLESLINQSVKPYEVVIADYSTDNTLNIVQETLSGKLKYKIIHLDRAGIGYARKQAQLNCVSDIILSIDADSVLRDDCVEKFEWWFSHPNVIYVCGTGQSKERGLGYDLITILHWFYPVKGYLMAFRKNLVRFRSEDELPISGHEDVDLYFQCLELATRYPLHYVMIYDPSILCYVRMPCTGERKFLQGIRIEIPAIPNPFF